MLRHIPEACFYKFILFIAMAITKAKKEAIVEKFDGVKADAQSVVFVNFNGLTVAEVSAMRAKLRAKGVGYFVSKKTLIERAFKGSYTGTVPSLDGQVAVAWSNDALTSAQEVLTFTKAYKDKLSILGGIFEGSFKNKAEMTEIAAIPPLQVLRGMFVNVINSPIQGFAIALDAIAKKKETA